MIETFTEYCPLCAGRKIIAIAKDKTRNYFRCINCELTFVPSHQRLDPNAEKSRYDYHQNSADDKGYVRFLEKLFVPVNTMLSPAQQGLDFGCGPGPTLHCLFEEAGHQMDLYDYFYFPNTIVFEKKYDFITASEVVEHLFHPMDDLHRLWTCLKSGGLLSIMTKFVPPAASFETWHYKNDDTHVCFYSATTFKYLATLWNARLILKDDIAILKKLSVRGEFK